MHKKDDEINRLLNAAKAAAGSDGAIARTLGVDKTLVSDWRHGRRACMPEDRCLIADIAGLDPVAELSRALCERYAGTPKGDRLMRVLGKTLLATGAAMGSAGASAAAVFGVPASSSGLVAAGAALYTMYRRSGL